MSATAVFRNEKTLIVAILVVTQTFEDFILKWLPVSDAVYSGSRFLSELTVYALFFYFVVLRLLAGGRVKKTPIDGPLLLFLLIAFGSIFVNDAPLLGSMINMKALLRYIALFYVVVNLNLDPRTVRGLILLIIGVALVQSLIGIAQALTGGVSAFWLPRPSALEIAGYTKEFTVLTGGVEKGAVMGAFGHPVAMALYLMIAIVCLLSLLMTRRSGANLRSWLGYGVVGLLAAALLLTYSRAALAACLLAVPFVVWRLRGSSGLLRLAALIVLPAPLLLLALGIAGSVSQGPGFVRVKHHYVNPFENVRMLTSAEYWQATRGARQWIIRDVGGVLVRQTSVLGFSPNEETARAKIAQSSRGALTKVLVYKAFEDVYWVAMLAYYGFAGLAAYLFMLFRLYVISTWTTRHALLALGRSAGAMMATLIVVTIPLTLIVRTFEFRVFGFYFWLLAGLMFTEYTRARGMRGRQAARLENAGRTEHLPPPSGLSVI